MTKVAIDKNKIMRLVKELADTRDAYMYAASSGKETDVILLGEKTNQLYRELDRELDGVNDADEPTLTTKVYPHKATWRLGDEIVEVHRSEVSPNAVALCAGFHYTGEPRLYEIAPVFKSPVWSSGWNSIKKTSEWMGNLAAKSLIHLPKSWGAKKC